MKEPMQEVRIWVPFDLLATIDDAVAKSGADRAEFIREAIFEKMKKESTTPKSASYTLRDKPDSPPEKRA